MRTILTAIFILFVNVLYSQVETRYFDEPANLEEISNGHIKEQPIIKAVNYISASKVQEKKIQCKKSDKSITNRYGYPIDMLYTLHDGSWSDVEGGRVWSMTIVSENANSLNFALSNVSIPKGAELYIIGKDNQVVFGPVTSEFINKNGSYLTDLIPGDESTIYLYEPSEYAGESELIIEKVIHGIHDNRIEEKNGILITPNDSNVACSPDWVNSACGVAGIYNSDGRNCGNGTLMMSTDMSFRPYVLLSYDAIDSNGDHSLSTSEISTAENWMFRFNKRYTDCDYNNHASPQVFNGATLRSSWYNSGFALMELNNEVTSSKIRFQGWDRSSDTPSQGVCIYINGNYGGNSHLSICSENHSLYSKLCSIRSLPHWVIGIWDSGNSLGGTYGSPLFNQDYRVVGHYNHSSMDIGNGTNEICFGKLPSSWTGGGTNTTRLSNWLDPVGTGQTTINSSKRVIINGPDIVCGSSWYYLTNLESSYNVTWSFKNASYLNCLITTTSNPNECYVSTNNNTTIDNILVATLWRNGTAIGAIEKHIITPPQLTGTITQTGVTSGGYIYPSFTIPIEEIFGVNQKCYVTMHSPKFKYMNVSYTTNPQTLINIQRIDDETISFRTLANTENIGIHFYFTGDGNCNDFELRVVALREPINTSAPLYINMDGNIMEIGLIKAMFNAKYNEQDVTIENLNRLRMPKSVTLEIYEARSGSRMFNTNIDGEFISIDTSGWKPGVYIVKVTIGDKILSEKVVVK